MTTLLTAVKAYRGSAHMGDSEQGPGGAKVGAVQPPGGRVKHCSTALALPVEERRRPVTDEKNFWGHTHTLT
jgi:hypothetical protein